jgi:hypothetical protein
VHRRVFRKRQQQMKVDQVYKTTSAGGQAFYYVLNHITNGLVIHVFHEEPSEQTEEEDADATYLIGPGGVSVLARLWDGETEKAETSAHCITLIEGKRKDVR